MKVVIPMAGRGTRLRPHTLNLPKPLLQMAGKSMIEWIIDEIKVSTSEPIDEIHYVIGDFGEGVENMLKQTAEKVGSKGFIHYQHEALGTAHAIYCAEPALEGKVFVVFADTIFKGKIEIDHNADGMIWTMLVDEPEKYGVVKTDKQNVITDFIEKPKDFISNNAIVGLYYFKEAEKLRHELKYLIDNDLRENNEFQLTNCLETLKQKDNKLICAELDEWLDCGNKVEFLNTHKRLLQLSERSNWCATDVNISNSDINNYNSIGEGSSIINSKLENCIIYENAHIENCILKNSIVGNNSRTSGLKGTCYLGDYSEYEV